MMTLSRKGQDGEHPASPPTASPLDDSLVLSDSRILSYLELGDPHGQPVILMHGMPGSRKDFAGWQDLLLPAGVRGIAVDRPGFGRSDAHRGRRLQDWPADVAALLDHLGLTRSAVLGVSGGGPHALACAALLADRVTRCVLVSSGASVDTPLYLEQMSSANRAVYRYAARFPRAARLQVQLQDQVVRRWPKLAVASLRRSVGPEDAAVVARFSDEQVLAGLREATAGGTDGVYEEMLLHGRPWGLDLRAVTAPVSLWHGAGDRLAPLAGARAIVAALPQAELHVIAGRGHLLEADPAVLEAVIADLADR